MDRLPENLNEWLPLVTKARELTVCGHEEQLDRGGLPYVLHPLTVASMAYDASGRYILPMVENVEKSERFKAWVKGKVMGRLYDISHTKGKVANIGIDKAIMKMAQQDQRIGSLRNHNYSLDDVLAYIMRGMTSYTQELDELGVSRVSASVIWLKYAYLVANYYPELRETAFQTALHAEPIRKCRTPGADTEEVCVYAETLQKKWIAAMKRLETVPYDKLTKRRDERAAKIDALKKCIDDSQIREFISVYADKVVEIDAFVDVCYCLSSLVRSSKAHSRQGSAMKTVFGVESIPGYMGFRPNLPPATRKVTAESFYAWCGGSAYRFSWELWEKPLQLIVFVNINAERLDKNRFEIAALTNSGELVVGKDAILRRLADIGLSTAE